MKNFDELQKCFALAKTRPFRAGQNKDVDVHWPKQE
jgi:hypothetical protein